MGLYDPTPGGNWFQQYLNQMTGTQQTPTNQNTGAPITDPTSGLNLLTRPLGYNYNDYYNGNVNVSGQPQNPLAGQGGQSPDFIDQLWQEWKKNAPGMPSAADILNQATTQANAQYDPQIAAIRREMGLTQNRANQNKGQINDLYSGLANSYTGDTKASQQQYKGAKAAQQANMKDLQNSLATNYAQNQKQQVDQMTKLGIQQAIPQTTQTQNNDLNYLSKLASVDNANQQGALNQQGNADVTYNREGAGVARNEGAQAVTDLMNTLNNYLTQRGGDITGLQGQKQSAIQLLQQELQGNAAKAQQQFNTTSWDNLFKLAQFRQSVDKSNPKATTGLLGANQIISDAYGNSPHAKDMGGLVLQLLSTQPFSTGYIQSPYDKTKLLKMNPAQGSVLAGQFADQQGMTGDDKRNFMNAIIAYLGGLGK